MNMRQVFCAVTAAASVMLTAATAQAVVFSGMANLDGAQEVPMPTGSLATGVGMFSFDSDTGLYTAEVAVSGIDLAQITFPGGGLAFGTLGPLHIHVAPAGSNGPIVVPFPDIMDYTATADGFVMTSTGDFSNTLQDLSVGQFVDELRAGGLYFNLHSLSFGGGEIRGQLSVPEPGTLAILGLGLLTVVASRTRRSA